MPRYGAIEGGGSKWICGVGTSPQDLETITFPTTSPEETLAAAAEFFKGKSIAALGIATFGPVDPRLGDITNTPKPGWRNTVVLDYFRRMLKVPIGFDTDVNGAALGEARWGAARGLSDFIYLTVGTGVGGGAMVRGELVHGRIHPEMGHMLIPHDANYDPFVGSCPFHEDCLEGLASGPAMAQRWGLTSSELPNEHPGWAMEAHYLALAVHGLVCAFSPQRIIMGGGVLRQIGLLQQVDQKLRTSLNGYVQLPEGFLIAPELGELSGVSGALVLAEQANRA